jgi:hypothetical protein
VALLVAEQLLAEQPEQSEQSDQSDQSGQPERSDDGPQG